MKKALLLIAFALLGTVQLMAQQNSRPGFVITQTGDSLMDQVY